jgi:hypothetical protein
MTTRLDGIMITDGRNANIPNDPDVVSPRRRWGSILRECSHHRRNWHHHRSTLRSHLQGITDRMDKTLGYRSGSGNDRHGSVPAERLITVGSRFPIHPPNEKIALPALLHPGNSCHGMPFAPELFPLFRVVFSLFWVFRPVRGTFRGVD